MEKTIKKRNVTFKVLDNHRVAGYCPNGFFTDCIQNRDWEEETFIILEKYAATDKIYLDVGAWIGPTVLFAAKLYEKIVCFEADPIALLTLEYNILINDFEHVILEKKALAAHNGKIKFGGNWEMGNSESTILVNDTSFLSEHATEGQRGTYKSRTENIVEVAATTIETTITKHTIDANRIALIKMDIEGGEYIVIPAMKDFLQTYTPNFYVSLHFGYLLDFQINEILAILFEIYNRCYTIIDEKEIEITQLEVTEKKIELLVFEKTIED
ncbi:FkbM family methyltransferase [Kordia sp. YSTF-M3]|uniref:FkbM family methyltransferase n=1 Tax=Kordia aestuariivivens TaxID=2759037 RepID=A0ABR7Q6W9_9FLAO|nr:FkbM family methyltransferase [Kordia aestuariivivens]MBC8754084.1 FkbM family methyltransferase [Kordia aestuariivivens]